MHGLSGPSSMLKLDTTETTIPSSVPVPSKTHAEASRRRSIGQLRVDTSNVSSAHSHAVFETTPDCAFVEIAPARTPPAASPRSKSSLDQCLEKNNARRLYAQREWHNSQQNAAKWRSLSKWLHFTVPCCVTFTCTFASTPVLPTHDELMPNYHASGIVAILPFSMYVLGMFFGPVMSTISAHVAGRRTTFMISLTLFAGFILGSARVESIYILAICRFFAGICGATSIHTSWLTVDDLWASADRTLPTIILATTMAIGPTLGQVVGGFVVWEDNWRWSQYCILFALALCALPIWYLRETSEETVLQKISGLPKRTLPSAKDLFEEALQKPVHMLTKPAVLTSCLCGGSIFGITCALFPTFEEVFAGVYSFSPGMQGLSFISMTIGILVGLAIMIILEFKVYRPAASKYQDNLILEGGATAMSRRQSRFNHILHRRSSSQPLLASRAASHTGSHQDFSEARRRNSVLASFRDFSFRTQPTQDGLQHERNNSDFSTYDIASLRLERFGSDSSFASDSSLGRAKSISRVTITSRAHSLESCQRSFAKSASSLPPAAWRLWPALPAATVIPPALFTLGWTTRSSIHWIAPLSAMGTFACAGLVIFVSMVLYMREVCGPEENTDAVAATSFILSLFGFALPLIAVPMFDILGPWRSMTMFAGLGLLAGGVPLLLYVAASSWSKRRPDVEA